MKESELQREITKALHKMPDVAFYTPNTTGKVIFRKYWITIGKWFSRAIKSHDGLSDITGMKTDGIYFAIEVKLPGFKPSQDQKGFIDFVNDNNGLAGYATTVLEAEMIIRGFEIQL